jgi:hypothetical protein
MVLLFNSLAVFTSKTAIFGKGASREAIGNNAI